MTEPPVKRRRVSYLEDNDDEEDELACNPREVNSRRDPNAKWERGLAKGKLRFKSRLEALFAKFENIEPDSGDEIEFSTNQLVRNKGHFDSLQDWDKGLEDDDEEDEEESRLSEDGNRHKKVDVKVAAPTIDLVMPQVLQEWRPQSRISSGVRFPLQAVDPIWQTPDLPFTSDSRLQAMSSRPPVDPKWQLPDLELKPESCFGPSELDYNSEYSKLHVCERFGGSGSVLGSQQIPEKSPVNRRRPSISRIKGRALARAPENASDIDGDCFQVGLNPLPSSPVRNISSRHIPSDPCKSKGQYDQAEIQGASKSKNRIVEQPKSSDHRRKRSSPWQRYKPQTNELKKSSHIWKHSPQQCQQKRSHNSTSARKYGTNIERPSRCDGPQWLHCRPSNRKRARSQDISSSDSNTLPFEKVLEENVQTNIIVRIQPKPASVIEEATKKRSAINLTSEATNAPDAARSSFVSSKSAKPLSFDQLALSAERSVPLSTKAWRLAQASDKPSPKPKYPALQRMVMDPDYDFSDEDEPLPPQPQGLVVQSHVIPSPPPTCDIKASLLTRTPRSASHSSIDDRTETDSYQPVGASVLEDGAYNNLLRDSPVKCINKGSKLRKNCKQQITSPNSPRPKPQPVQKFEAQTYTHITNIPPEITTQYQSQLRPVHSSDSSSSAQFRCKPETATSSDKTLSDSVTVLSSPPIPSRKSFIEIPNELDNTDITVTCEIPVESPIRPNVTLPTLPPPKSAVQEYCVPKENLHTPTAFNKVNTVSKLRTEIHDALGSDGEDSKSILSSDVFSAFSSSIRRSRLRAPQSTVRDYLHPQSTRTVPLYLHDASSPSPLEQSTRRRGSNPIKMSVTELESARKKKTKELRQVVLETPQKKQRGACDAAAKDWRE